MAAEIDQISNYDRIREVKEFDESKIGTKGLSESGITSIPKFFIHSPELRAHVTSKPDDASVTIPTIDLFGISSPTHRTEIVRQVKEAASKWGFFHIINHGILQSTIDSTILAVKNFHDQPAEVKSKYYNRDFGACVKYSSNDDLLRSEAATWHDSLQVMTSMPHVGQLDPMDIPEVCRGEMMEWDRCAKLAGDVVMELLSEGLGLKCDMFKKMGISEGRMMVAHCYSYCPQPELTLGIAAHTDTSFLTVLLQDEIGGLQVKNRENGNWMTVKPVKGGLTINIGDTLEIVSNGEYNSVQHRVLANSKKQPRISIATFFNPIMTETSRIGPLPELLSLEKPAIYRPCTLQDMVENFHSKGLDSKSLVERVNTSFADLLAFSGPAPERINGRLAMVGFVAAIAVELAKGQDVFSQISEGGASWFVGTSVLLTVASLVPLFKGVSAESKSDGVMTSNVELWNGRFAMLGLVALACTELVKGGALI